MNTLRQQMIDIMTYRNFSPRTHEVYLGWVIRLAKYYQRTPEKISEPEIEHWLMELVLKHHLAPASVRQAANGITFLYQQVLKRDDFLMKISLPKRPQKIPALLTPAEVRQIIQSSLNSKHYALLSLCYGCGLRLSELIGVQCDAIESTHLRLKVVQGKGKKDRIIPLPPSVLTILRAYWHHYRPVRYLFNGRYPGKPLSESAPQRAYKAAKAKAGVTKPGGIHGLRHAFATHQLDAGMPIHQLKEILGHTDIKSTMRYLHWCPQTSGNNVDLLSDWPSRPIEEVPPCPSIF